ncbi:MAG: SIMPL domain-containing protein [Atopobium sp.]|nr:SIMPL domain-containing protein [Atopobium sp.]
MKRTIDVSTNLSTQVPPDTIDVDITIRGTSKIREDCTAKYNVLLQTVKDALEKNGLPASILKNNNYSVSGHEENRYKKDGEGDYYVAEKKLLGYDFHAKLSIKQHLEEDLVEKIWKALSSCGDKVTFSVEFSIAHNDTIKDNLSVDAIVICRQKANLLAHAAGAKVVGLKHADYDFDRRELMYKARNHSVFYDSDFENQVPTFDSSDIDIYCYVDTTWEIELLPPDDLL